MFPDVIIANNIAAVTHNAAYRTAKAGDIPAAMRLMDDTLSTKTLNRVIAALKGRPAIVQPVHALEAEGVNRLPSALAEALEGRLRPRAAARVGTEIVQVNNAGHTGASGWHRIASPTVFDGVVEEGMAYLLVDDFVGQGAHH